MLTAAWRIVVLLVGLALSVEIHCYEINSQMKSTPFLYGNEPNYKPYTFDEEVIHRIQSMIDAYRRQMPAGQNLFVDKNPQVDTKYRTWKRNVDLINSLLALPKDMNDAGR